MIIIMTNNCLEAPPPPDISYTCYYSSYIARDKYYCSYIQSKSLSSNGAKYS